MYDRSAVEILLRENANINLQDQGGCSPLHLAAWKGYSDICLLLLNNPQQTIQINTQVRKMCYPCLVASNINIEGVKAFFAEEKFDKTFY